jgi:hypothetical protein
MGVNHSPVARTGPEGRFSLRGARPNSPCMPGGLGGAVGVVLLPAAALHGLKHGGEAEAEAEGEPGEEEPADEVAIRASGAGPVARPLPAHAFRPGLASFSASSSDTRLGSGKEGGGRV